MPNTNKNGHIKNFSNVATLIKSTRPVDPVYCLYPHVIEDLVERFIEGFPGTVMYAVKANPDQHILHALYNAGIRHFDTASIPEIELIREHCPEASCHFMAPVRLSGTAGDAYSRLGIKHFVIDHPDELKKILAEIEQRDITIFVRMATHDSGATFEFSSKFGATVEGTIDLLESVAAAGARPALAFNVGSLALNSSAYAKALQTCSHVMNKTRVEIHLLDIGGGFPSSYPGLNPEPLEKFFDLINNVKSTLPHPDNIELLGEPGRALVADGMSVVTQVILRKDESLYLNDGIYGSFAEPVISDGMVQYPTRIYRDGEILQDELQPFTLFGPSCDSLDRLPLAYSLPRSIQYGDWIEFGMMGAYSMSNRTRFNGFYPDTMINISDLTSLPPGVD
jgi:ornithine decarboxylase